MKQLTPDDFKVSIFEEAAHLRRTALGRSNGNLLDPKTALWLVTPSGWEEMRRSADLSTAFDPGFYGAALTQPTLYGLPIRVTVNDIEGTPHIQLVMQPDHAPRWPSRMLEDDQCQHP